jgi:clan AA aspartic protease
MALNTENNANLLAYPDGEILVGLTHSMTTVSNPADLTRGWQGRFLVDTGAIDSMVPAKHLRSIGIEPCGSRTYQLADGTDVDYDIGVAAFQFFDSIVGATVIFGNDDSEPILGVTALESAGIVVEPQTQELKRIRSLPLK